MMKLKTIPFALGLLCVLHAACSFGGEPKPAPTPEVFEPGPKTAASDQDIEDIAALKGMTPELEHFGDAFLHTHRPGLRRYHTKRRRPARR